MAVRRGMVRRHGDGHPPMHRWLTVMIATLFCFTLLSEAVLAAPDSSGEAPQTNAVNLGGGAYRVTASVFAEGTDGQVGTIASSGHLIQSNDNLVALPGCTESSCPWVATGTGVNGTYGPANNLRRKRRSLLGSDHQRHDRAMHRRAGS